MTDLYWPTVLYQYYTVAIVVNLGLASVQAISITNGSYHSTHIPQITICQDLNYAHHQECHITNSEIWTCLKTKALSVNSNSCPEDRRKNSEATNSMLEICGYLEICAFTDDAFSCDASYNCTVAGYGELNCTKDYANFFNRTCTPSLLYCPAEDYSTIEKCVDRDSHVDEFREKCIAEYEDNLTKHSLWFYVQLSHYDNVSERHGILKSVHHRNWQGDESNLCSSKTPLEPTRHNVTLIVSLPVTGGIILMAISYALYEGRNKWKKRQQNLRRRVEEFVATHLEGFNDSKGSSVFKEETQAPREKYDAISDLESVKDLSLESNLQNKELSPTETMPVPHTNDDGETSLHLNHNWDNPCYVSKKGGKHHNQSTISHSAYFPKTEVVQAETDLVLPTQLLGLLENSSQFSTSQNADSNCNQQDSGLDANLEDNSVSDCDTIHGAYMTKNYLFKTDE